MALAIPPKLYWKKGNYPTFIEFIKLEAHITKREFKQAKIIQPKKKKLMRLG